MSMAADTAAPGLSFEQRHHFWIRRLHSLTGIVPLGVFLFFHLFTNASVLGGARIFDENVYRIHSLGPLVVPVEMVFIFIPLAFHVGYGLIIARQARMNASVYGYTENKRFSLQRITAWIATVFIVYHVMHMHWLGEPLKSLGFGAQFDPEDPARSAASAIQKHWIIPVWYTVGVFCTVYHFANGLWTFMITWGITVGQRAQRVATAVCALIGIVVAAAGFGAVYGFATHRVRIPAEPAEMPHVTLLEEPQASPADLVIDEESR